MKNKLLKASLALTLAITACGANAQSMFGLTDSNQIFIMPNASTPSSINGPYAISGVVSGQILVGLDSRQGNGRLYAMGYNSTTSNAQLYNITGSGTSYTATTVGPSTTSMALGSGTRIGFDFISTLDNQVRITSSNGNSYAMNTDNGALTTSGTGSLTYASNDVHSGASGAIAATSYSNNYYGADAADEYGYDVTNNLLVKFDDANYYNNANNYPSTVHSVGVTSGLVLNGTSNVGMDNWYDNTTHSNTMYLTGTSLINSGAHLYKMNDTTGLASDMGAIGSGSMSVNDIAFQSTWDTANANSAIQGQIMAALTLNMRNLIFFDSKNPSYIRKMTSLNGMTAGQSMLAIAYGYDAKLYGLGYNSSNQTYQLYNIDSASGNVTAVNNTAGSMNLGNTNSSDGNNSYNNVGFNFIGDATNRIRVTGNNGTTNMQLNATTGLITETDSSMQYANGDANFGSGLNLSSIAYTNGGSGSNTSSMIGYDANLGMMVTLNSDGNSDGGASSTTFSMNTLLNLFANNSGYRNGYMDIFYDQSTSSNVGFMIANYYGDSARSDNYSTIYSMDNFTSSGTATPQGNVGSGTPVKTMSAKKPIVVAQGVSTVQNNGYNNSLLVYPNPALNNTRIELPAPAANDVYVDLIDLNGRLVHSYQYGAGSYQLDLDLSSLPTGMYSARVTSTGTEMQNVKILKQ